MDLLADLVAENVRALVDKARTRGHVGLPQGGQADGWRAYAPRDGAAELEPPSSPWAKLELTSVTEADDLLTIAFRWLGDGQRYVHVTDLAGFSPSALGNAAAVIITYQLQRLLQSPDWPVPHDSLRVGDVIVVAGRT